MDILASTMRSRVNPDVLRAAITEHTTAFAAVHGEDAMIPKFHFALHLPGFLSKFGMLQSCLLHERKHRVVKKFANDFRNTGPMFDPGILREVTSHSLEFTKMPNRYGACASLGPLRAATAAAKALLNDMFGPVDVKVSASAHLRSHVEVCAGDMALTIDGTLHEVAWFAEVATTVYVCGKRHLLIARCCEHSRWRNQGSELQLRPIDDLLAPLCWASGSNEIVGLVPYHLR